MIIQPVTAPTLSGLTATPAIKGNLLKWDATTDQLLLGAEVWASQTNDRATASKEATVYDNTFMHFAEADETWYYWIRALSIYGRSDGQWLPESATAGVASTSLLAQTNDIALNAITNVSLAQEFSALSQTAYSTWENVILFPFMGTGSNFIIDTQHLTNLTLTTIGTTLSAYAQHRLILIEHTIYNEGKATVTNGSAIVTGIGTTWLSNISAGHIFFLPGASRYTIASVDSDTQLTLSVAYANTSKSDNDYYVIKSSASAFTLNMVTDKFTIKGAYCVTQSFPYRYRMPIVSAVGKLYDIQVDWSMIREDASWSISNSSVLRTLILEEVKR